MFGAMLALELRDPAVGPGLRAPSWPRGRATWPGRRRVAADALAGYVAGARRSRGGRHGPHPAAALVDAGEDDHAPGMRAMVARVLLEACVVAGDARTGLVAADGALGLDGDVRTWASEARRRRAEFLAALGAPAEEVEAELGARSRSPAARAPGCSSCGPRPACSATVSTPATTARRAGTGSGCEAVLDTLPERGDTPDLREAAALLARG